MSTQTVNENLTGKARRGEELLRRELGDIRAMYESHRFAFIAGDRMFPILRALGARMSDMLRLSTAGDHLAPDPTLSFRRSRNGRFLLDYDTGEIRRLGFQPFVLSEEEDFVRHDSGQHRHFRGIQDEVQLNTAFQALLKFKSWVIDGMVIVPRPKLNGDSRKWVSTVFHLRTITTPSELGEPALEGVHSDGVEHTMTTFLGATNMRDNSAVSLIHDNRQQNGQRHDQVDPALVVGSAQHLSYLDTLLIVDSERKHSLSPVYATDVKDVAWRDMLIFFTRRPTVEGHPTHPYDALDTHPDIPLSFALR
jgi:hypothetical protein